MGNFRIWAKKLSVNRIHFQIIIYCMTAPHNQPNNQDPAQQNNPPNNQAPFNPLDAPQPSENGNNRPQGVPNQLMADYQFIQLPFLGLPMQSLFLDHLRNLNNLSEQPLLNNRLGLPQDAHQFELEEMEMHSQLRVSFPFIEDWSNPNHTQARIRQLPDTFLSFFRTPMQNNILPQYPPQFTDFTQFLAPFGAPLGMVQQQPFWNQGGRILSGRRIMTRQTPQNVPNHVNKKYYNKPTERRVFPTTYSDSDPFVRISYVKQNDSNQEESYSITAEGLVGSKKNTDVKDIMIGRQLSIPLDGEQIFPNDIVLPINDRAISRVHCKIQMSEGFQSKDQMQKDFEEFQRICYKSNSYWNQLPKNVLDLIREFAYTPAQFYIQDLGSVQGTYLKVRNNRDNLIETGNIYFIGAETIFHIKSCLSEVVVDSGMDTYDVLAYYKHVEKDEIHGLTPYEMQCVDSRVTPRMQNSPCPDLTKLNRPFVKIDFQQINPSAKHIFLAKTDPKENRPMGSMYIETLYKFGRNQDNDVVINYNTISRKQCRIKYCPNQMKWFISDGEQARESSNGTWMSVCDWYEKQERPREESRRRVLEHNSEIKISESVLKVEMINFHKMIRYSPPSLIKNRKKQQKQEEKRQKFLQQLVNKFRNDE